ncbi:MAG: hypothetical protein NTV61_05200 [Candidatus Bathyarchaeota archaeon]|nr:hypothetical protein [Candidatus Bathyarchaeota archaeon]
MYYKRPSFWIALSIIAATALAILAVYLGITRIPFSIIDILGIRNSPIHWLGWAGSLIILATTTAYSLRKRSHKPSSTLLKAHAFGNLLGFTLISIHFIHEVTRPAANYPQLGTGIILYSAMLILVATGITTYFAVKPKWGRYYRYLHPAVALTLLMAIIVHIIHGI